MGFNGRSAGLTVIAGALAFATAGASPATSQAASCENMMLPKEHKQSALKDSMRRLWTEHVIWSREYVLAALRDEPDETALAARIWKNQNDIGEAFAPYYGDEAATKIADLLKRHILIGADVVDGIKADDSKGFKESNKRWHENDADIAELLSGLNPNWSRMALLGLFDDHLALTTKETATRIMKVRASDDIAVYDEILRQAIVMADELSNGIIKQFPNAFYEPLAMETRPTK